MATTNHYDSSGRRQLALTVERLDRRGWTFDGLRVATILERIDATDNELFARLLDGAFLAKADPDRGSFRAFLRTAVRNYVTDQIRRGTALKRSAGPAVVSLEHADIEPVLTREWRR